MQIHPVVPHLWLSLMNKLFSIYYSIGISNKEPIVGNISELFLRQLLPGVLERTGDCCVAKTMPS